MADVVGDAALQKEGERGAAGWLAVYVCMYVVTSSDCLMLCTQVAMRSGSASPTPCSRASSGTVGA